MSIATGLYNLLIGPLELLFEVIFDFVNRSISNPGLSIVFLSLAVNFLVLPLYRQADAMQEQSRQTEARLHHWVSHIKKTFTGDERFMMLQTYYRQNNYKPTDALKGSMSLLLEIPFFMAAYNFLSGLQLLNGVSFGPIHDLGTPDAMLVIAGVTINVLPILMTAINLISGAIYTKGFAAKDKVQLYGMALIFLVFLYDSPSGLVFYWTLNNLFSLVKNIFYKLKNPKRVLGVLSSVCGAGLMVCVFVWSGFTPKRRLLAAAVALAMQLPLVYPRLHKGGNSPKVVKITRQDRFLFHAGCVFAAVLTGLLIPTALIKTSPEEFVNAVTMRSPLLYVLNAAMLAAGMFIVWFGIFYMLASPSCKKVMGFGMWAFSGAAVVDYMFFGRNYGNLSPNLIFDVLPVFPVKQQLLNLAVLAVVTAVLYLIWKKKAELVKAVYLAAVVAAAGMSAVNAQAIHTVTVQTIRDMQNTVEEMASIPLDQTGKNVVVLMMDRAINSYIPYIFNEKPEVARQFAGFTYYPNTISYGGYTNVGSPALYGGYEYTPKEMNKRSEEKLADKQNEALKVMPVIFHDSGYETTVCDPTYAGYRWIPDLSIYDDYPQIHTYITMGKFNAESPEVALQSELTQNRNLFCYSLFKIAPVVLQPNIYTKGTYNAPDFHLGQVQYGLSKSSGLQKSFMNAYGVLTNLPQITHVTNESRNTFVMLSNDTTHEPMLLQEPAYEPAMVVDNTAYDRENTARFTVDGRAMHMDTVRQMTHYHVNMAAMIQLGNWLDYLRENDVYDNTRIIIVSDHGKNLGHFDDMKFGPETDKDAMSYQALLMVKDFGATEFTTDTTFMTNGDVPTLATKGLIDEPVNPFTGKPINDDAKNQPEHYITGTYIWDVNQNNGNTFLPAPWYVVGHDPFNMDQWRIEEQG